MRPQKTTLLIFVVALMASRPSDANTQNSIISDSEVAEAKHPAAVPPVIPALEAGAKPDGVESEMTAQGHNIRGVYMPVGKVKSWSSAKMLRELKAMGANAVILDVKDDMGRVTFSRELPMAKGSPHGYLPKLKALVQKLKDNDIYVIARLVCFKDNWFAGRHKEIAVRDSRTGEKWKDRGNLKWIDPYSQTARDHIVSIATAAEELGFDEIQLDYVRFPVDANSRFARYPSKKAKMRRYEAIAELLRQTDAAISLPLSIDVFGLTAYHPEESEALGQYLEALAPHIDAISPMVYLANWPAKYYENPSPEQTHALIAGACRKIRDRLGDRILVRPLLQGFSWRAENWGYGFVLNQIDAATSGGSSGYLFWNAGGRYKVIKSVWLDMDSAAAKEDESTLSQR